MSTATDAAASSQSVAAVERPIIFFDGVCGLCNRFVDFVLRCDRAQLFLFAPLQGETAHARLGETDKALDSVVLLDRGATFERSAAVVRILWKLGGIWTLPSILLWLVPRPIRDAGYRLVANFRYQLFGKKEGCRVPTLQERERFLA